MDAVRTLHALERAKERLGFVPNFKHLIASIKAGRATEVHDATRHLDDAKFRFIYDVPYGARTIRVVVDASKSFVVSVLPPET